MNQEVLIFFIITLLALILVDLVAKLIENYFDFQAKSLVSSLLLMSLYNATDKKNKKY